VQRILSLSAAMFISLLSLPSTPLLGQSQSTAQNVCPDEVDTTGKYVNYSYGFSIIIPPGLKGTWNSARCVAGNEGCVCMSDHGRIIPLSERLDDTDHWIEAYASFAADPDDTVQDEVNKRLDWIRERSVAGSASVLRAPDTKIGGISAKHVIVRYRDKESNQMMVEDFVEALWGGAEGDRVEYSVYLRSPIDVYEQDKASFDRVLSSFALATCHHC
jgi:hypothetical protein